MATHRPCDCTIGRACLASRAISAALNSMSSNRTLHVTALNCCAPTIEPGRASVNMCNDGRADCGDSSGARTSNPIDASIGPVLLMNSHASCWLSATCPRREALVRDSTSHTRSRRVQSFVSVRPPSERTAVEIGTSLPAPTRASTLSSHTPCGPGASSCTTNGW